MPWFPRPLLLLLLALTTLLGCSGAPADRKNYRIGIVNANKNLEQVIVGFKEELAQQGYVAGQNTTYLSDELLTEANVQDTINRLVQEKVDLLLALTTPSAKKAKSATAGTTIPVVFAPVFNPVESELVTALAQPGGNLTGVQVGGATSKALGWLLLLFPETKTLFVPYQTENKGAAQSLHDLQTEAEKRHIHLLIAQAATQDELKNKMSAIPKEADAIWILNAPLVVGNLDLVTPAAIERRLPVATATGQYKNGVLLSYGQEHSRTGAQAGRLAGKILRGTPPAELPVETCDYFLGLNLQTAQAMGLEIPDEILRQADFIIR